MMIPPEIQSRLQGLRLTTRVTSSSRRSGIHRGSAQGAGLEFAQYRAYDPGDELRRVDWKLYARSDRFFVREAVRDGALCVWLILDASASMGQADAARPHYSKLDAARILCACIAEIALQQSDVCGLATVSGAALEVLPAATGRRHTDRLQSQLLLTQYGAAWPPDARLLSLGTRIGRDSLVVFISDGFDAALPRFAKTLAAAGNQVLSLGLISAEERDFPFDGGFTFKDPETGDERRLDGAGERDDFLARFARSRADLKSNLSGQGVRHLDYVIDEPMDAFLRRVLQP